MRFFSRRVEVPCLIDIEQTEESFHAHAIPDGITICPGDVVIVHDAPRTVRFGERIAMTGRVTVYRAGPLARALTRLCAVFALTELYEVGFQPKGSP